MNNDPEVPLLARQVSSVSAVNLWAFEEARLRSEIKEQLRKFRKHAV